MGKTASIMQVFLRPSLRGGNNSGRTLPGRFASLSMFKSYYQCVICPDLDTKTDVVFQVSVSCWEGCLTGVGAFLNSHEFDKIANILAIGNIVSNAEASLG